MIKANLFLHKKTNKNVKHSQIYGNLSLEKADKDR